MILQMFLFLPSSNAKMVKNRPKICFVPKYYSSNKATERLDILNAIIVMKNKLMKTI